MSDPTFTPREIEIMAALWTNGPLTVRQVRDTLDAKLALNTVDTLLRILEEKGHIGRAGADRPARYQALVKRETAAASVLDRLVSTVFDGSDELMFNHLVSRQKLGRKKLEQLRAMIDAHLAGKERGR